MGVDIYLTKETSKYDHLPEDFKDIDIAHINFGTLKDFGQKLNECGCSIQILYGTWTNNYCREKLGQFEHISEEIHWLFPIIYQALKKAVDEDWELHIY